MSKTKEMTVSSTPTTEEGPDFRQSQLVRDRNEAVQDKPEPALLESPVRSPDKDPRAKGLLPKLYGRHAEEQDLLAAYRRCASSRPHTELVLISGPSGTGKVGAFAADACCRA
jgi:DNA-binding NtrC family response regulator